MKRVALLSLFPLFFESPLQCSILRRAQEAQLLHIDRVDIREFAEGSYRQVDDRPYGGGPGMVMMAGPLVRAIEATRRERSHVIYLSPQGEPLTPQLAREIAKEEDLLLVAGHYEGIDERVIEGGWVDREVSIGDYVLTNGCLAALVLLDAMARYIPGVLGHELAAEQESFEQGIFDHPHYTRPEVFQGREVPNILLSGDHAKIAQWRAEQAKKKTAEKRPDLYQLA